MPSQFETNHHPIQLARQHFFEQGTVQQGLIAPLIERSWQRCFDTGLRPDNCGREARLSQSEFREVRDRSASWLDSARPQLDSLYAQIKNTHCAILMADAQGTILHGLGDTEFLPKARRVELMPGGVWSEPARGTNAIGTAAREGRPVVVHAGEHYLDQNGFLTCAAVPIFDPHGAVLGVLDISSDAHHPQHHTLALANLAASMIENQWLERSCSNAHLLYFHPDAHLLGGLYEGVVAYDDDGRILGSNRWARHHLALEPGRLQDLSLTDLFDTASHDPAGQTALQTLTGDQFHARHREPARPIRKRHAPTTNDTIHAAFADLSHGDPGVDRCIRQASRVLGRDVPILLQGETGVGKEVWARALHQAGPRRDGPLITVNCAAIPETLIEAELFGYRGGAFTGADRKGAPGRILEADGGTLFLDEIGDMPLALQTRLLRVLQERQVTPVGGGPARAVRFDLISATHADLDQGVQNGTFRGDLFYRINGFQVRLPPLRERQDFDALVERMLTDQQAQGLTADVWALFRQHPWPGNLRQLHSVIHTAALLAEPDEAIDVDHLPSGFIDEIDRRIAPAGSLADAEADAIQQALDQQNGNMSAAARQLGIDRSTLYRKLKQLEVE